MYQLPFLDDGYEHGPIRWLKELSNDSVPEKPGVYVLFARPGVTFMYPRWRSAVFYVGKGRDLRRRLRAHAQFSVEASKNRKLTLYWRMYEYAAFGCRYTFFVAKPRENIGRLEGDVLAMFDENYRSWRVANTIGSWSSLNPC